MITFLDQTWKITYILWKNKSNKFDVDHIEICLDGQDEQSVLMDISNCKLRGPASLYLINDKYSGKCKLGVKRN